MPRNEKGEIYISNGKGFFMLFCCTLWMVFWGCMAYLADSCGYEILGDILAIGGISSWGLVPLYFFRREEQRYPQ